jgi:predicted alpha/beta hydrolase
MPLQFDALDGFSLGADLFEPEGQCRGAVVMAPATGVPRRIYSPFAAFLQESGFSTLTFDYRGIGDSRRGSLKGFPASMHDWGEQDLAGAIRALASRHPGLPLQVVGHSAGGQIFGLLEGTPVRAALMVGSQSGYWKHWDGVRRAGVAALWHVLIPGFVGALGYLPMSAFRMGEDLPRDVALEWARWGRNPEYLWSYAKARGGRGFTSFEGRIRSYAIADDGFAPVRSVAALLAFYTRARTELKVVAPKEVGAKGIGHFGFFRRQFRDTLWADALEFLRVSE